MRIDDRIFGKVEVDEPVLLDLINSKPLQRLKTVHNGGPCQYIHRGLEGDTRFAHSVGVMCMLRNFGAPLEEQIAGLLHDVSHTAFSHLADYVFGGDVHKMDFQDRILDEFILKSAIPEILERHGLRVQDILDTHRFPLLEQEIPDLCADRMEYSLGHAFMSPYLAPITPREILNYVAVNEDKFVMNDQVMALKYAQAFLHWYTKELAGPRCLAAHQILADAIKRAIELGAMTKEDMFGSDEQVMDKLRAGVDSYVQERIFALTPEFDCVIDEENPDLHTGIKFRYIDPPVLVDGVLARVSQIYPDFAQELAEQKQKFQRKDFPIRITNPVIKNYAG